MTERTDRKIAKVKPGKNTREERLKAALKANMGRRKAQARARASDSDQSGEKGS